MKQHLRSNQTLRLLFWETTIKCNLTCAHCRRLESDEAAVRDLSTTQAKDLIKQLAELGKNQAFMPMLVFSGGEPLCREDLFELAEHARSLDITTALATNGTLIDATTAERIRNSGIARVAVSLDGSTAEVHDKLRQVKGAFEKALKGINHLREKNIPFQINTTLTKHNAEQLEDIYELAKTLGAVAVHIFMLVPVGCGQLLAETDMLTPQQYEQVLAEICKLDSRGEMEIKVTCGPHYQRIIRQNRLPTADCRLPIENQKSSRGCLAGIAVSFVSHQGDVFPCGYLPVKCGNVLEEKLLQIWFNNNDLARLRDSSKLEGKCGRCNYRQVCGGCRARAYSATDNYMAEEPFCAYIPPEVGCQC